MIIQENFTETKISTKFGKFNFRVYEDSPNKETIVLWTEKLNTSEPVLVRIHSECITGDLFGSYHCDCGNQLEKSLDLIQKEGGVLIYLRQEGRGIGLFEKIKTYQLQAKGYDTYEANVILGHRPDERSYVMARIALEDMNIHRIRLLTNNPSKVSELSKLGIEVIERIPIIIKPNEHNKKYFETKKQRFQHSFEENVNFYFYQFHVDDADQVNKIGEFISKRKLDPFLKIYVGISTDFQLLNLDSEKERIRAIYLACNFYDKFIPVLHFSFRNLPIEVKDLEKIKAKLPFINHLQLNDLKSLKISFLKKASDLFYIYLPLDNEKFNCIENHKIQSLILKKKILILLDNSKGRGIKESKDVFMKKIDVLMSHGINNIALCGGFGPDELKTYFDIRRYYRINLSIDAESKLKTNGQVDVEKIKLYLLQLVRFDDPKEEEIKQTKQFLIQNRRQDWETTRLEGHDFAIHPQVFHAGLFPASSWCASILLNIVKNFENFCEVGSGSGVISCLLAQANPNLKIVATDINPYATENTRKNVKNLGLEQKIDVFTGDVLDGIENALKFDGIFWLLPFGYLDPGEEVDYEGVQVFDPGYRATRKFFQTAKKFLKSDGKLLIGFSSDLGNEALLFEIAKENNLKLEKKYETILKEDREINFQFLEGSYTSRD